MTQEEKCYLWLTACTKLDYGERVALLNAAENPALLFREFEKFSKTVLKEDRNGLYISDVSAREKEVNALSERLERKNRFAVTMASSDYPEGLRHVFEPPHVLYGKGNRELLKREKFCIVGSRITPPWAEQAGRKFAEEIADKFVIVTGIAEGGDSAAISGAFESGNIICVLPCGLDDCYPASQVALKEKIARKGLLLSEFPFQERVHKGSFHARNRILAGLAKGVLVISAGCRSGTLITANCALDSGKDVFVFPYNLGVKQGEGCNNLVKTGAFLVTEAEDILSFYGYTAVKKQAVVLGREETLVMEILSQSGELHAAVIAERAGLQVFEAAATLSSLELKGLVTKSGGNKYSAL